ncbi:MAG TPA: ADOP family duplicated permease, partial [Gemmatimonadales bacterium]|nr:ADOP family duplicated permease [Gemmatimonadales bacterium]
MTLQSFRQDLRYALRGLRRQPAFSLAVVLTLGLGLGVNAAMFGIVDRLLLRAPSYLDAPDRVHRVYLVRTFDGKENFGGWFQYTRFKDIERWSSKFEVAAGAALQKMAVGIGDEAREMSVSPVSASYWRLFRMRPALGRFFGAAEDTTPVGAAVAVLSYPFWQSRFGGRSDVLGQRLEIGKVEYRIIGVAPQGFNGAYGEWIPVAWVPLTTHAGHEFTFIHNDPTNWYQKYNLSWMTMLVRRKAGVSQAEADADLSQAFQRSYANQRSMSPGTTLASIAKPRAIAAPVQTERGPEASAASKVARWVGGVALVVLLIAAANVANLLLARALRRRREVALRLALGVTRARLFSQLLTESLVLSLGGGALGLLLAQLLGSVLRSQFLPAGSEGAVLADPRTLLFSGLAVLLVAVLTGLAPALHSGRGELVAALKSGAREGSYQRSRTRAALLVFQGALSMILLVGAGLFVRSLRQVRGLELGFDLDRVLWVSVEERGEKLSDAEKINLRDRLAEAARAIPGVENASRAVTVPFWMSWDEDIHVEGIDSATIRRMGSFQTQGAGPQYLATMGTKLLRGRFIEPQDQEGTPKVMVVSASMAQTLWPNANPLGKCVRIGGDTVPCTEVVGVAQDIRTGDLAGEKLLYYYRPISQVAKQQGGLFVRVRGDAGKSGEAVRKALQPLMPGSSYVTTRPMSDVFAPEVRSWRLGATMFVAFGGLALALAAIGLYSVISYNVAQRTQELGVRVALGAQTSHVVRLVLGEGFRLTLIGLAIGAAVALWAGKWVAPLLFRVKPADPAVFASVALALFVAASGASLLPALR